MDLLRCMGASPWEISAIAAMQLTSMKHLEYVSAFHLCKSSPHISWKLKSSLYCRQYFHLAGELVSQTRVLSLGGLSTWSNVFLLQLILGSSTVKELWVRSHSLTHTHILLLCRHFPISSSGKQPRWTSRRRQYGHLVCCGILCFLQANFKLPRKQT